MNNDFLINGVKYLVSIVSTLIIYKALGHDYPTANATVVMVGGSVVFALSNMS